jgi:hypothetical protein
METQIGIIVDQVREHVPAGVPLDLIALGADVRFAASQMHSSIVRRLQNQLDNRRTEFAA